MSNLEEGKIGEPARYSAPKIANPAPLGMVSLQIIQYPFISP